jgi:hypothetical protein
MVAEALDVLIPEKRIQLYRILRLRVSAELEGTLKASGEIVNVPSVCKVEPTHTSGTSVLRSTRASGPSGIGT